MGLVLFLGYATLLILSALWAFLIGSIFYEYVVARNLGLTVDVRKLGEWAVVTGATDGIGKCYAIELAKRGLNILILGRNAEKLENASDEISKFFSCHYYLLTVDALEIDFAHADLNKYKRIEEKFKTIDIGVLVNNVGMCYSYPEYLHQLDLEFLLDLINVNCVSTTVLTHMAINQMLPKKRGAIVNISSSLASFPTAFLTAYSASKCVSPFYVVSKMSKIRKPSFFIPLPGSYAKSAVNTIGVTSNTNGTLAHSILVIS
ncbi:estradiol 17 beta dehydrogenase 12 [Trichuris trichiura]|uniref:Estradiol 17 beta dehydrogenase 12 n=1 Tax=Trichuris trichiura TaxID=36087 RepID=A0A077YXC7_TRITR|nr:estradiol 17 beta dehydrogenase 12 [Trichuris trichiura]